MSTAGPSLRRAMEKLPDLPPPAVGPYYSIDQLLEYGMQCKLHERQAIKALIKDDARAAQHETFPRYRTALLRAISRRSK